MSHPEYDHYGTPPLKVIEECSELIMAISKAERFGYLNHNPSTPSVSNLTNILSEVEDVKRVLVFLEEYLKQYSIKEKKEWKINDYGKEG